MLLLLLPISAVFHSLCLSQDLLSEVKEAISAVRCLHFLLAINLWAFAMSNIKSFELLQRFVVNSIQRHH